MKAAMSCYLHAAEAGEPRAQYSLGLTYLRGDGGVERNAALAEKWADKSAEQGNPDAECLMGLLLMGANGRRKDSKAALDWYLRAAERGHSHAQYTIGWMMVNGEGVPVDRARALPWLRKARDQGNDDAADLLRKLGH